MYVLVNVYKFTQPVEPRGKAEFSAGNDVLASLWEEKMYVEDQRRYRSSKTKELIRLDSRSLL